MMEGKFSKLIGPWLSVAKSNRYMILVIFLVSGSLIVMNYYTIRTLSGVRAYIQGESYYSKGQKDASQYLLMYMDTEDEKFWELFRENLKIPLSDREARIALENGNYEKAEKRFIVGENHPDDIGDMIWLFTRFQHTQLVQKPLENWAKADSILIRQQNLGREIKSKVLSGTLNDRNERVFQQRIFEQDLEITVQEAQFLKSLGQTSRKLRDLILWVNTLLIIAIVGGASFFSARSINKLRHSEERLLEKNKELKNTNAELDKFVYSASHDLRAPITSLKGLIKIIRIAKDPEEVKRYYSLMEQSLDKQDDFIRQIISFSKNKRAGLTIESVNIEDLIDGIVTQLKYMDDFTSSSIVKKNIVVDQVNTDAVRLEIILSNLISNAVKYRDPNKEKHIIEITAVRKGDDLQISVEDNGIGITEANKQKIFDMFYMSKHSSEGTGVGLYIVKEAVEKLKGNITVESEAGKGSLFRVKIPMNLKS